MKKKKKLNGQLTQLDRFDLLNFGSSPLVYSSAAATAVESFSPAKKVFNHESLAM